MDASTFNLDGFIAFYSAVQPEEDTRTDIVPPPDNTKIIRECPKEVLAHIHTFLSLYDCINLSKINRFFHSMFFIFALRPDYRINRAVSDVPRSPTIIDDIFLFVAKTVTALKNSSPELKPTDEHYIFDNFPSARHSKFLMYDELGQDRLKRLGLDGALVKSRIANGDLTEEQALLNKEKAMVVVDAALSGNYSPEVKKCLASKTLQECLIVGLLDITNDAIIFNSPSIGDFLEHPRTQDALRHRQITREHLLQYNDDVLKAMNNGTVLELLNKEVVTLQEVIQHPLQVLFLAENSFLVDALCSGEISKQQIVEMDQNQMNFLTILKIKWLIKDQVELNTKNNVPPAERGRTMSKVLELGKNPRAFQVLSLDWVQFGFSFSTADIKPLEEVLMRTDFLLEIEAKHGSFRINSDKGVSVYFLGVWWENLNLYHCYTAEPETLRCLLLGDIDGQISKLVKADLISVKELLELKPERIQLLAYDSVNAALLDGKITSAIALTWEAEPLLALIAPKTSPTGCSIQ
jgi:hypothetical protein